MGGKPVHVFVRIDGADHLALVQVARQGELHEDAVDRRVLVQALHGAQQLLLRGLLRQAQNRAVHAELFARALLVAHVDGRGGVLPHEHDRKAGRDPLALERLHARGEPLAHAQGNALSLDDAGRMASSSLVSL